jgi:uncharacterized protein involved in response to NO
MDTAVTRHLPSAAQIAAAPHRLLFLLGALNVLAAMAWWAAWLAGAATPGASPPASVLPAGWAHAFAMQYQVLPPFIFGFLLTVFPRWMGLPELTRWHYLPVGLGLVSGQVLLLAGLAHSPLLVQLGVFNTLAGWTAGLAILLSLVVKDGLETWHAFSCAMALMLGWFGLLAFTGYLLLEDARWLFASVKLGSFGLLVPMYFTVAHRMFPFFAGNVVAGYRAWRPMPLLAAFWVFALAHLLLELAHAYAWLWIVDAPWCALVAFWLLRTWPRGAAPALLRVLFLGAAWLPVALALFAAQSLYFDATGVFAFGRAPAHALFIGFFGSLLVAMVTRVTKGHSGRPLVLGVPAALAFVTLQLVAVVRIAADLAPQAGAALQLAAAAGWLLAFLPWVLRSAWIYLTPRADGRPG